MRAEHATADRSIEDLEYVLGERIGDRAAFGVRQRLDVGDKRA